VSELQIHTWATWAELALALVTLISVFVISAPYGRHMRKGWGPEIGARAGWVLMEAPTVLVFLGVYLFGDQRFELVPLLLLGLWQFHYVRRTFVYPFLLRGQEGKTMPLFIALSGVGFNTLNATINARWIGHFGDYSDWLSQPWLYLGAAVFLAGWGINVWADKVLRELRRPGETGYKIPQGGLYEVVSCPNYLGEILEWTGWAIATLSLPGLAFALYTVANLGPRALTNHRWYQDRFPDYPARRKALIPFVL
jgi:3-oxo-5-alpha-steroid 4-dehydrogenase 1